MDRLAGRFGSGSDSFTAAGDSERVELTLSALAIPITEFVVDALSQRSEVGALSLDFGWN